MTTPDLAALRAIAEEGLALTEALPGKPSVTDGLIDWDVVKARQTLIAHAGTHYATLCRALLHLMGERERGMDWSRVAAPVCGHCHGRGYVVTTSASDDGRYGGQWSRLCRACDGSGRLPMPTPRTGQEGA